MAEAALQRRIGLGLMTAYGVGVIVGAGIYVLVGAVAAEAGLWAPLAFLLSAAVALPSAMSYAELTARMPVAAGEAAFIEAGFDQHWLALAVGMTITISGVISGGAVLRGGVGYLASLVPVEPWILTLGLGLALSAIAIVGVIESLVLIALFTAIEVGGLILVAWAGLSADPTPTYLAGAPPDLSGIASAIALCFFAYLGFEDMENMAEEVRDPTHTMPRAIMLSLLITALLYAAVSLAAVRAVPLDQLAASPRPLATVWEVSRGSSAHFLSLIAVAAAINGVLVQIVMAARVLFGLGRRSRLFSIFTHADPRFGTPMLATLLAGALVTLSALALPVELLARITSAALLAVFLLVNAALIRLKRRHPDAPFHSPDWMPWFGIVATLAALAATWEGLA